VKTGFRLERAALMVRTSTLPERPLVEGQASEAVVQCRVNPEAQGGG
jgi:hypothetical protein